MRFSFNRGCGEQGDRDNQDELAYLAVSLAGCGLARTSSTGGKEVSFPHLHQAGPAVVAIEQAENRPHDSTPLLITGAMLAPPGFGASSHLQENDVVAASHYFAAAPRVKSVHGFASEIDEKYGGQRRLGQRFRRILTAVGSGHCIRECEILERAPGSSIAEGRHRAKRTGPSCFLKHRIVPARLLLSEGEGDQARAEKREAGRSQCQEAVGDEVMVAHDVSSESMLARID